MKVRLLTPVIFFEVMRNIAVFAAQVTRGNTDLRREPEKTLLNIIKLGHGTILEHITLSFYIEDLSRACLQELARHRHITLSVESTRYTLKKKLEDDEWVEKVSNSQFADVLVPVIQELRKKPEISNDVAKYTLPECWPTNLVLTTNIRELRHILDLRTSMNALREFRDLGHALFEAIPKKLQYLVADCVHEEA